MNTHKQKESKRNIKLNFHFLNRKLQRLFIALITFITALIIIYSGAIPQKYNIKIGDRAPNDIFAPRDIENKIKTEEKRLNAMENVKPITKEIVDATIQVLNSIQSFFSNTDKLRNEIDSIRMSKDKTTKVQYNKVISKFITANQNEGIIVSKEQANYLLANSNDVEYESFKKMLREFISSELSKGITIDTKSISIGIIVEKVQSSSLSPYIKSLAWTLTKAIVVPNRAIDFEQTKQKQEDAFMNPSNVVKVLKDSRILLSGEIVTKDVYSMLDSLGLVQIGFGVDFPLLTGLFIVLFILMTFLLVYLKYFNPKVFHDRNEITIISMIFIFVLLSSRFLHEYNNLSIPIFSAAMLLTILIELRFAIVSSTVLSIAIMLMVNGDLKFLLFALSGSILSSFLVSNVTQRSKISMAGLLTGILNVVVIIALGLLNRSEFSQIIRECWIVFLNGIGCAVLTIGLLPFFEIAFNIITPLKLLELTNPSHPLLKRLLMEAPGTYHHSLMVGNLAEVGTTAIGGNPLLARVGAYFHDVGKIKHPNYFIENQLTENPHNNMTPNLSTLVITSHVNDGVELAIKHNVPIAVRSIIKEHHGNTMLAYFFHKAKNSDMNTKIEEENFRYNGPRPSSKEAAVVMLADSVEAAVRSMGRKTEEAVEQMVKKIIKDKLNDHQFDLCDITLKDLDLIKNSFLKVFTGYFHEREEYPESKEKTNEVEQQTKLNEKSLEDSETSQEFINSKLFPETINHINQLQEVNEKYKKQFNLELNNEIQQIEEKR